MNPILIPWYIMCAILVQTSALVISAFAAVRYLAHVAYVTIRGRYNKEQVSGEMAVGIITYIPILAIVFGAKYLADFRNPLCCIIGIIETKKIIGAQATEIFAAYLGMKQRGQLEQDEMHGLNGFFKWLSKHHELLEDLILAPHRFLNSH